MKLSIVIVSYNCKEYLQKCLDSIDRNAPLQSYEVIVVDNTSKDGTRQMVRDRYTEVKTVFNERNAGFAAANNAGAKMATGEYILFLNPDTEVTEKALDNLITALDKRADVGLVGCRIILPDGKVQPFIYGNDPTLGYLFKRVFYMAILKRFVHDWDTSEVLNVDWVTGACMIMRAKAFNAIGGFDEQMFMYFEDNDLALRARLAGWRVVYYPHVEITHYGGKSMDDDDPRRKDAYFSSLRYFYKKHYGSLPNLFLPWFIAIYRPRLEKRSAQHIKEKQ